MNASMDFMIRLFLYLILSLYYLIVVALLLTMFTFVLFYAALRSRSIVLFLMLRTPQHSPCLLLRLHLSSDSI